MTKKQDCGALRDVAVPLSGSADDYAALLERIGDARYVLLGEATHGSHEFYAERARITQSLILHKGFNAVAIEGDFPDAHRVHCFVTGASSGLATDALEGFRRFPTWMWRNAVVLSFVGWLRAHNDGLPSGREKVGFYGLDLYSLYASMESVLKYLDRVDAEAAVRARQRYGCFNDFLDDSGRYGYSAGLGLSQSCEEGVSQQLRELQERLVETARGPHRLQEEELFYAEQNARLVKNAEEYYRTMFRGAVSSWNLRDRHMADTLDAISDHIDRRVDRAKIVVWAHNSHVGDARATSMCDAGEWNLGQLVRERHGDRGYLVGFTTYGGTVTAASTWEGPAQRRTVRPALPGSHEALLHDCEQRRMLLFMDDPVVRSVLGNERLHRAIGVVYRPETERRSHYYETRLTEQFDALIHVDTTRAVEPLEARAETNAEVPETFPSAL